MERRWPIAAGAVASSLLAWHRYVTPWQQRWGATDDEVHMALPGDELVPDPADQATRAVTIGADPADVWPWIVQLGADRAGFYSYTWLENLFGLRIHNADRIESEWQELAVGDLVAGDRRRSGGWYVMRHDPREVLVLAMGDVRAGRPVRRDEGLRWEFLWTFAVRPLADGGSRLIVRERTGFGSRLTKSLLSPLGFVSFVMTRAMLLGIRSRAEATVTRPAR